jgi:hypothetical protein
VHQWCEEAINWKLGNGEEPTMPTDTGLLAQTHASSSPVVVEIASVATAVPRHVVTQADANERARIVYPQYAWLDALYTNTGIDTRYSVEPVPWHLTTHTWEERTDSYQRNALELLEQVARQSEISAPRRDDCLDEKPLRCTNRAAVAPAQNSKRLCRLPRIPKSSRKLDAQGNVVRLPLDGIAQEANARSQTLGIADQLATKSQRSAVLGIQFQCALYRL